MKRRRKNWMGAQRARILAGERARQEKAFKEHMKARKRRSFAADDDADKYFAGLRKKARAALPKASGGRVGGKKQLNDLFHELYGRNPVATKRKKRKSKKGTMPAGLKRYWAKKRAAKRKRKNSAKRPFMSAGKVMWSGGRPKKRRAKKRKASGFTAADRRRALALLGRSLKKNPRRRKVRKARRSTVAQVRRVSLPAGLTAGQTKKMVSIIRRVSKRRVRVK
jgi:hypothetical protein